MYSVSPAERRRADTRTTLDIFLEYGHPTPIAASTCCLAGCRLPTPIAASTCCLAGCRLTTPIAAKHQLLAGCRHPTPIAAKHLLLAGCRHPTPIAAKHLLLAGCPRSCSPTQYAVIMEAHRTGDCTGSHFQVVSRWRRIGPAIVPVHSLHWMNCVLWTRWESSVAVTNGQRLACSTGWVTC
jgi:hypothetical protein